MQDGRDWHYYLSLCSLLLHLSPRLPSMLGYRTLCVRAGNEITQEIVDFWPFAAPSNSWPGYADVNLRQEKDD